MVDVFSVLPRDGQGKANEGGKKAVEGQRNDTQDANHDGYKPSPVSLKQLKVEDLEPIPISQAAAYRSVRRPKSRNDNTSTAKDKDWEAAKAVMG